MRRMIVAAVDPGREKCGLAVVAEDGRVLAQDVVAAERLAGELCTRAETFSPTLVVLGNGTTSAEAEAKIRAALPNLPVTVVDEYRTTDDARRAYWQAHPPTGWRRLLPTGMQVPPVPVDDFVAVILARRYLERQ
mgnify:CR=1 FL=1